jgi:hypothetical protein
MGKKPLQVYLDDRDRKLLEEIAEREGVSLAEALRLAIRWSAADVDESDDPLLKLIGTIDDPSIPADMSTRGDEYEAEWLARESFRKP